MSYILRGPNVYRESDGASVSPADSATDAAFVEYLAWVRAGNEPKIDSSYVPDLPKSVPDAVTMRQARLALLGAGKLSQVSAALSAMPEPQRSAAQITWEYSAEVRRSDPLIAALAPALGMTAEQIDALFVAAAAL